MRLKANLEQTTHVKTPDARTMTATAAHLRHLSLVLFLTGKYADIDTSSAKDPDSRAWYFQVVLTSTA